MTSYLRVHWIRTTSLEASDQGAKGEATFDSGNSFHRISHTFANTQYITLNHNYYKKTSECFLSNPSRFPRINDQSKGNSVS